MTLKRILFGSIALMVFPKSAYAQVIDELHGSVNNGVSITSNADNSHPGQEYFIVNDSGSTVFYADGDATTDVINRNDIKIRYDNDASGAGSFSLRRGSADVLTANNAGTVTIHNSMVANGINNGNDGITNAGAVSGVTSLTTSGLATLNAASITTTLGVDGATTLNDTLAVDTNGAAAGGTRLSIDASAAVTTSSDGATTANLSNSGHVLAHVDGSATNAVIISGTQQGSIGGNAFNYGTRIIGGALVDGDLGVNGSIYALNPTANTGINVGANGLAINGATNTTALIADSNSSADDGRSAITLQESQASILVNNQSTGEAHGLAIEQSRTVLSGGTRSTSLMLDDHGATFANMTTGAPARVTGVANGTSEFDAVNYGQLRESNAGIASVAAMANIPGLAEGRTFALGLGYGHFEGENALAFGGVARLDDYTSVQMSIGHSGASNTVAAGVGISW